MLRPKPAPFSTPPERLTSVSYVTLLGTKGWLAPGEPDDLGGAGLSPDLTVIVLEEMNRRGLLSLVDGEAQALRSALIAYGTPAQRSTLVRDLALGQRTVWRHAIAVSPDSGLDTPTRSASSPSPTPTATSSTARDTSGESPTVPTSCGR